MSNFEEEVHQTMIGLIDKGMVYAKLDNEGEELSPERIEKLWFNVRLRERIMFSLTPFGTMMAKADDQREAQEAGEEVDDFPRYFV